MTIEEIKIEYRSDLSSAVTLGDRKIAWQKFLAQKHLLDGSIDIFKVLQEEMFSRSAGDCNAWLNGTLTTVQLLKKFIALRNEWIKRLFDFGLSDVDTLPFLDVDIKVGKLYDSIYPLQNPDIHRDERYKEMVVLSFELLDFFYQNHVPTLSGKWRMREEDGLYEDKAFEGARQQTYSTITITDKERDQITKDYINPTRVR